jgi:CubicO group peptidase (beta-lactamase class C family)
MTTRIESSPLGHGLHRVGDLDVETKIVEILGRHPAVGLAVGVARDGRLELFFGHGLADIASNTPVTADTVFRIGSITKTFTAIAVMQLWEKGLVDLDAPANDYLRAYRLGSTNAAFRPATVRHLLTHTAGIPDALRVADLLHPSWGPFDGRPPVHSVAIGEPIPSLAECYRGDLRSVVEPGTDFAYSNHGFATLGQIVEDVSGIPLRRYFREQVFGPLGMADTDLVRSERIRARLATGHVLGPSGATAVTDREWVGRGGGGIYSSSSDMARFAAALLGGGSNEHGSVLQPATLATMFQYHYQSDSRLPGMGLGFFRHDAGGHRLVGHDGILPGFNSSLLVAPDDEVGIFAITNGSSQAMVWLSAEIDGLLREMLRIPDEAVRSDIPQHPEIWGDLCGRYQLSPVGDLRGRLMTGAGAQILVRRGRLMVRLLTPIPPFYRGIRLHPDDEADPYVFRLDLSRFGMPTVRLVFDVDDGNGPAAMHTDLGGQPISLYRAPSDAGLRWPAGAATAGTVALATTFVRRARRGRWDSEK